MAKKARRPPRLIRIKRREEMRKALGIALGGMEYWIEKGYFNDLLDLDGHQLLPEGIVLTFSHVLDAILKDRGVNTMRLMMTLDSPRRIFAAVIVSRRRTQQVLDKYREMLRPSPQPAPGK